MNHATKAIFAPLTAVLLLTCSQLVWAQTPDECQQVLEATNAQQRATTLEITTEMHEWDVMSYGIHPDSDFAATGFLFDLNHFASLLGNATDGMDRLSCEGNVLTAHEYFEMASEGTEASAEIYDPPLTWLVFPLNEGNTWSWSGSFTFVSATMLDVSRATLDFLVLPLETLDTPLGPITATPVQFDVTDEGSTVPSTRVITWVITDPVYSVVQQHSFTLTPGPTGELDASLVEIMTLTEASWLQADSMPTE